MKNKTGFPVEKLKNLSQGGSDDSEFFTSSYLKNGKKSKFGTPDGMEIEQVNWFRSGLKKGKNQKNQIIEEEEEVFDDEELEEESFEDPREKNQRNHYRNFKSDSDEGSSGGLSRCRY